MDVKLGVPCLDAACTVGRSLLSVARNPDKPTQNKFKNKTIKNKPFQLIHEYDLDCFNGEISNKSPMYYRAQFSFKKFQDRELFLKIPFWDMAPFTGNWLHDRVLSQIF